MDDSVLEKLPEILTEEACKKEVSKLDTPLKTSEVTEGYNMSPCLTTLFGLDYSTASKQPELRHYDVEEKIPVSDIVLQINSSLLSDTDDEDESHDLDIAEETVDEEKIVVSIGGMQKGNLLVKDQADENQSVDSVSSLQNDNVLFEDDVNDQASNEFAEYEECATMKNTLVSNGLLQNDSLLVDKCCQAQSIDFSSNQGFQSLKLNLDAGNWNEDDQFEILHENQVLEIPAQQTSYSELQDGEECRKEYISASYEVQKNPILLVNIDGPEHGLNDSKTIEKYQDSVVEKEEYQDSVGEEYQDSVVEKEEQIEQFSKNETQDAQETVSPKNYNDDQNDLHFVVSYDEVQKAMKDEAHEYKSYYSDNSKEFYGLDELNGSTPQKEEDDRQQIYKNEVHEGESMDCSNTPELKNKLKFDADNLNGAHLIELLPKTLSLENLSQLASYSEAQEPGECSNEEISVLNDVQESHITLVNGEAQEDKLSDSKTSERFHDTVYEKEEQYECVPIVVEIQNTEEIISPMIYNGKQNDGSHELLDAVWLKVENSQEVEEADEDVQASEFCLQSCNSVMKDEVHLDNFFSDNSEEFYGVNQYVSTPQKEADGVE